MHDHSTRLEEFVVERGRRCLDNPQPCPRRKLGRHFLKHVGLQDVEAGRCLPLKRPATTGQ